MALFLEENRKKLVPPERVDSSKPYDDHMSQFFFLCHRRFEEVSQDTHALHRAGSRGAKNFSFFFVIAHFSAFFPNFMITIWISIIKTNAFSVHIYTFKSKYIALLVNKIFLLLQATIYFLYYRCIILGRLLSLVWRCHCNLFLQIYQIVKVFSKKHQLYITDSTVMLSLCPLVSPLVCVTKDLLLFVSVSVAAHPVKIQENTEQQIKPARLSLPLLSL